MAAITASMVAELRAKTDAPMMECKKALTEADGDMAKAEELLRVKLGTKAGKAASRVTAEGVIAAAAIDVWYRYPGDGTRCAPSDLPFGELPNVLMTPHSSGVTSDTFAGRVGDVAANIVRLQRGTPLRNVVTGTTS